MSAWRRAKNFSCARNPNARTFLFAGAPSQKGVAGIRALRGEHAELSSHANHTNHGNPAPPILLTIAGFDPSCGAGIAADLKTFAAHNCYGIAAVTALTVQSTQGARAVHATPSATLRAQLEALAEDSTIAGVKIGMLANRANACVVAEFLEQHKFAHVVLDPISRPTSGNVELLDAAGLKFVRDELLKRASVITPNIAEAELLAGMEVKDVNGMKAAGQKLLEMGAKAVIVTGGHLERPIDVLCEGTEIETFGGDHVKSPNTHGSGCTFSSAIAAQLACGQQLREAAILAKAYVTKAIEKAYATGKGPGALNQLFRFHQEPPPRGVHEVPQHGMHPAAEPAAH